MFLGLEPWSAFAVSSMVTGFLGRLATPWFSRIFKKKNSSLPTAPAKDQAEPGAHET
jgi:hypothetical protein